MHIENAERQTAARRVTAPEQKIKVGDPGRDRRGRPALYPAPGRSPVVRNRRADRIGPVGRQTVRARLPSGCCAEACRAAVADMVLVPTEPDAIGRDVQLLFSAIPARHAAGEVGDRRWPMPGSRVCSNACGPPDGPRRALADPRRQSRAHRLDPRAAQAAVGVWQACGGGRAGFIVTNPNCSSTHLVCALEAAARRVRAGCGQRRHHAGPVGRGLPRCGVAGHPGQRRAVHRRRGREDRDRAVQAAGGGWRASLSSSPTF